MLYDQQDLVGTLRLPQSWTWAAMSRCRCSWENDLGADHFNALWSVTEEVLGGLLQIEDLVETVVELVQIEDLVNGQDHPRHERGP